MTNRGIRKSTTTRPRLLLFGLAVCLLLSQNAHVMVHGFANNLVGSNSGCMTMLDPTEAIMNYKVKAAEDSDFPRFHLVVVEEESGNHIESPYHYKSPAGAAGGSDAPPGKTVLSIAFVNPYTQEEFHADLQFVMEVFYGPDDDGSGGDKIQSNPPAEFLGGGAIGCKFNRRVSARLRDNGGVVQLRINNPTSQLHVVAGWATEHESVRLTPLLLLKPSPIVVLDETNTGNKKIPPIVIDDLDAAVPPPKKAKDDSNIDAAAADAAADDDGKPVVLDDEVQEEVKVEENSEEAGNSIKKRAWKGHVKHKPSSGEDGSGDGGGKVTLAPQQKLKPPKEPRWQEEGGTKEKYNQEFVIETPNHDSVATGDSKDIKPLVTGDENSEVTLSPLKGRSNLLHAHNGLLEKALMRKQNIPKGNAENGDKSNTDHGNRMHTIVKKIRGSNNIVHKNNDKEEVGDTAGEASSKKSFRHLYDSDEFAGGLHIKGYISGCLLLVVSFGCLLGLGRRREKGRRDL
jgi:hypothetical protein